MPFGYVCGGLWEMGECLLSNISLHCRFCIGFVKLVTERHSVVCIFLYYETIQCHYRYKGQGLL